MAKFKVYGPRSLNPKNPLRQIQEWDRLDAAYKDHVFDVVREFHLPEGQFYVNRFGKRMRHGFVIRDRATGAEEKVGRYLLHEIYDRYLGVTLPVLRHHTYEITEDTRTPGETGPGTQ